MHLFFVLARRAHLQDLLPVRTEIAIFQAFYDVVGFASSTTSATFVYDPELRLLDFI